MGGVGKKIHFHLKTLKYFGSVTNFCFSLDVRFLISGLFLKEAKLTKKSKVMSPTADNAIKQHQNVAPKASSPYKYVFILMHVQFKSCSLKKKFNLNSYKKNGIV